MYPLQVVLVHCGEAVRSSVRRELANQLAVVKAEYRDVAAALHAVGTPTTTERFLFVLHVRSDADLQELQRLSSSLPGHPILVLRDRDSDPVLFQHALRCGAAFTIPVPLEAEDLRTILNWIARDLGFTPRPTTVIAVASASGGVGATTVALNLADDIASRQGHSCLLVELALRMGMASTYLQFQPRYSIHDILRNVEQLDMEYLRQVLTPVSEKLHVLAGPQQAIDTTSVNSADVLRMLFYARPLADVVVVDVPCTYDDIYFDVLAYADHVVLLWEQKLSSVRAVQMVRAVLQRRGVGAGRQQLVVNRYDARLPGFSSAELEKLLQVSGLRTISNDSAALAAAANNGRPLRLEAPRSRALADITALAEHLLQSKEGGFGKTPLVPPKQGLFGRLVRTFGLTS
jgi:pilus assembly protein CpaE